MVLPTTGVAGVGSALAHAAEAAAAAAEAGAGMGGLIGFTKNKKQSKLYLLMGRKQPTYL